MFTRTVLSTSILVCPKTLGGLLNSKRSISIAFNGISRLNSPAFAAKHAISRTVWTPSNASPSTRFFSTTASPPGDGKSGAEAPKDKTDEEDHDHEDHDDTYNDALSLVVFQGNLYSGGSDGRIIQWKDGDNSKPINKGRAVNCLIDRVFSFNTGGAINCLINYNDKYLISGSDDGKIRIWNPDGTCLFAFPMVAKKCSKPVGSKCSSSCGSHCGPSCGGTCSSGCGSSAPEEDIMAICSMYTDGQYLFCGDYGGLLSVWLLDFSKGPECLSVVKAHLATVFTILRHGNVLFTGGGDNAIMKWDPLTLDLIGRIETGELMTNALTIWKDSLVATSIGPLRGYDLAGTHPMKFQMPGHLDWVNCAHKISKDRLVSGGSDGQLLVWSPAPTAQNQLMCEQAHSIHPNWILSVVDWNGKLIVSERDIKNKSGQKVTRWDV